MPSYLHSNGIDAVSGRYLDAALSVEDAAGSFCDMHLAPVLCRKRGNRVDTADLATSGWGVVFAGSWKRARIDRVRAALEPLLERRRSQAGKGYRELLLQPGDDGFGFLARHGEDRTAVADSLPYYLLLIGGADDIPFWLQHDLGIDHAVGRLEFGDPEDFAAYARQVVRSEVLEVQRPLRVGLFAVDVPEDPVTRAMEEHLITPVAEALALAARRGWEVQRIAGAAADRERLASLLGAEAPALLFAATHGLGYSDGHSGHLRFPGDLLCSGWQGVRAGVAVGREQCFSVGDLSREQGALGTVVFLLARNSAGTSSGNGDGGSSVSRLAQRLLAHPAGGALAVVGHVTDSWLYSFLPHHPGRYPHTLAAVARALVEDGAPLGMALGFLGRRYDDLTAELGERLGRRHLGEAVDPWEVVRLWTAANDARSHVILGDAAVRLNVKNNWR